MLKRIFDIAFSAAWLIVLMPVLAAAGIIIRLDSPGPVFYRGVRTGLGGRPFRIFKLRTMAVDADRTGGPSTALNDPRLTRAGRFLRKYKIDELPQLINVLKGEMSVIGPRPQVERYTRLYSEEEKLMLTVKPGLSDYASIRFMDLDRMLGDEDVNEKYMRDVEPEKNRLRMKYVRERSFFVDMRILFKTIARMLRIRSLWNT